MGIDHQPSMKVHDHYFARGLWDHHRPSSTITDTNHHHPSPSLDCMRLHTLSNATSISTASDLKSFRRPESAPRKFTSPPASYHETKLCPVVGGTRWNPTKEQIGILETLYAGGMRSPNAQQIEQITAQLSSYGNIQGKNVFYWFQNHKARDRQKRKRTLITFDGAHNDYEDVKRKCRTWPFDAPRRDDEEGDGQKKTLKLFPLHPEAKTSD